MTIRTRTRGSLSARPIWWQLGYPQSCANRITFYNAGPVEVNDVYIGSRMTTTDVVTKDYWKRIKAGEVIFNPYVHRATENKSLGSSDASHQSVANACLGPAIKALFTWQGAAFAQQLRTYDLPVNTISVSGQEVQTLQAEIWTDCLAKRGEGLTNLVESLAELDKAFVMVMNPLTNVRQLVRDFRRHGKRAHGYDQVNSEGRGLIRFASVEWLRFRYGISPLMNDLSAAWKTLKKQYDSVKEKQVITRASGDLSRQTFTQKSLTFYPYKVDYIMAKAHTVKVRAMHLDRYKPTAFDDLGLTFQNVVAVPWELTRYSFVVDWFANIGPLIYANIPRVGMKSYGGCVSTEDRWTTIYSPTSTVSTDPANWTVSGNFADSYSMTDLQKTRNIWGDGDSRLVIKSDFRLDQWKRALDAAALTMQQLVSISFFKH